VLINNEPLAIGETFQIGPADKPLLKISQKDIPEAGFNGATEPRWFVDMNIPLDNAAKQELLSQGATEADLADLITKYEFHFANRELSNSNDPDGAYGNSMGYGDQTPPPCGEGIIDRYYDAHLNIIRPCVTLNTVCDGEPIYEPRFKGTLTENCDEETPIYSACKDEIITTTTPKFDGNVPAGYETKPCYDFTEKLYDLKKTVTTPCFEVTSPGEEYTCWDGNSISPLAIDLNKDGKLTEKFTNPFAFDLDNNGTAEEYGSWFQAGDAVLGVDVNNNGAFDNGGELFGTKSTFVNGAALNDGYDALRAFANQIDTAIASDGVIDQAELAQLETAGLKASVNGQLRKLSELGVTQLGLDATAEGYTEESGAYLNPVSSAVVNGENALLADVWFSPQDTVVANTASSTVTPNSATANTASSTAATNSAGTSSAQQQAADELAIKQAAIDAAAAQQQAATQATAGSFNNVAWLQYAAAAASTSNNGFPQYNYNNPYAAMMGNSPLMSASTVYQQQAFQQQQYQQQAQIMMMLYQIMTQMFMAGSFSGVNSTNQPAAAPKGYYASV
jgi:hypothetical protein